MKTCLKTLPILGLLILGACRAAQLYDPGPTAVQASSAENMRKAILDSLAGRGWVAAEEQPGAIHATLFVRAHTAKIRIDYDADSFDIDYVDSSNLEYEQRPDGTQIIHENYNSWIRNLVRDISIRAGRPG